MESLNDFEKQFVLHWGEMGNRWGINRTVAQIHALLYLSPEPLHAEQISTLLSVARSNVSTSLKELVSWRLARVAHVLGDRRDHFETEKEVTELFRIIVEERKRREFDPTVRILHDCLSEAAQAGKSDSESAIAIQNLATFLEDLDEMYNHLQSLPNAGLAKFLRLGRKVKQILGV